jgi:hypothetical protein
VKPVCTVEDEHRMAMPSICWTRHELVYAMHHAAQV